VPPVQQGGHRRTASSGSNPGHRRQGSIGRDTLINRTFDLIVSQSQEPAFEAWLVDRRRHLHAHPELSLQEFETTKMIEAELAAIEGVTNIHRLLETGVVAEIHGTRPPPPGEASLRPRTVLLRGDCDALPMQDLKDESCPYRSQVPGVMHSCGHDVHVACMLGATKLLAANRDAFSGKVLLVYQPAEEVAGGGRRMVVAGVCGKFQSKAEKKKLKQAGIIAPTPTKPGDDAAAAAAAAPSSSSNTDGLSTESYSMLPDPVATPPPADVYPGETIIAYRPGYVEGTVPKPTVDAALALHVVTCIPVGTIGVKNGPFYAACDDLHVVVRGRGGHAGCPQIAINPVFVGANLVVMITGWLSRSVSPMSLCVLSITRLSGGTTSNIIPEFCEIEGTLRTHDETLREDLVQRLPELIRSLSSSFGAEATVTIKRSFTSGRNTPVCVDAIRKATSKMYGDEALIEVDEPAMGSEDFYEYALGGKVPAAMFWLGAANDERGINADNHNAYFDIDEQCLSQGASVMAGAAIRLLNEPRDIKPGSITPRKSLGEHSH